MEKTYFAGDSVLLVGEKHQLVYTCQTDSVNREVTITGGRKVHIGEIKAYEPVEVGCTDKQCVNCQRVRVYSYTNGDEICEKCGYSVQSKRVLPDFRG